nr:autotransporter domain-containing protein [Prosthecomicrobium pneumaticum]
MVALSSGSGAAQALLVSETGGTVYDVHGDETHDDLAVGILSGESGTVRVGPGEHLTTGTTGLPGGVLGYDAGATGVVEIDGAGAIWTDIGDRTDIGDSGVGVVEITSGGELETKNGRLGRELGGYGSVLVDGAGSLWTNTIDLIIGQAGDGEVVISNGAGAVTGRIGVGGATFDYDGDSGTGAGELTITGAGSTLFNAGGMDLGRVGASGYLEVSDGGALTFTGTGLYVGEDGAAFFTGEGTAINVSAGNISMTGGQMVVDDGATVETYDAYIGSSEATIAILGVVGPTTSWTTDGWFYVGGVSGNTSGGDGNGLVFILDGAHVTGSSVGAGMDLGSFGRIVVAGAGSSLSAVPNVDRSMTGNLYVGYAGEGVIVVAEGGAISAANEIRIAYGIASSVGTLVIGSESDSPAAAPGTVTAPKIVFGDGDGTVLFNHTAEDYDFDLVMDGAGTIRALAGETILSADSPGFSGAVDVEGGTLRVNGDLSGGDVTVYSGATLGGVGTIGDTVVLAGGVHAPGNSIGTQTIDGDYTNSGTLRVEIGVGGWDKLIVTGEVDVSAARLDIVPWPSSGVSVSVIDSPFVIIENQSGQASVAQFGSIRDFAFLDADVVYDAGADDNDVVLTLTRNGRGFVDAAVTRNQAETAAGADSLPTSSAVWNAVAFAADDAEAAGILDQLSGEIHASFAGALIVNSRFVRDAATMRLDSAFDAPVAQALGYGPDGADRLAAAADRLSYWMGGYGAWGSQDGDGNAAGIDTSTGGVLIGADGAVGGWRLGALVGYGVTSADADARTSSADSDDVHLGLYAGTTSGPFAVRSGLAYSFHSISSTRHIAVPGLEETLKSDYDAGTTQVFGEVGYTISTDHARFEPFAGLAYVHLATDGFTETGGLSALVVDDSGNDTAFATLGIRASSAFLLGQKMASLRGTVAWQHAFGDTEAAIGQAFDGGIAFTVAGAPIGTDAALVEAGLAVDLSEAARFDIGYRGRIGDDAQDHGLRADFGLRF